MKKAALIIGLGLAAAGTVWAQESTPAPEFALASKASRAEVQADLAVWNRAGLSGLYQGEGVAQGTTETAGRLAHYSRMRQGAEYAAELQRLQGGSRSQTAAAGTHQSH